MALKASKSKREANKEKMPMSHFPPEPPGSKRKRTSETDSPIEELTRESLKKHTGGEPLSEPGAWDFLFQHLWGQGAEPSGTDHSYSIPQSTSSMSHQQENSGPSSYTQLPGFPVRMGGAGPPPGQGSGSSRQNSNIYSGGVNMDMGMGIGLGDLTSVPSEQHKSMPMGMGERGTSLGQGSTPGSLRDRDQDHLNIDSPDAEHQRNLRAAVAHLTNKGVDQPPSPAIMTNANNMTQAQVEERRRLQEELRKSMEGEEATERQTEALQLITYHLNK